MQCSADRLRENQRCYTGMMMSHQSSAAFNVTALLRAGRDWNALRRPFAATEQRASGVHRLFGRHLSFCAAVDWMV